MPGLEEGPAMVTGACVGIGQGIAVGLARQGGLAVHCAQSEAGARSTVEEIGGLARRASVVQGDLADVAQARRVAVASRRRALRAPECDHRLRPAT